MSLPAPASGWLMSDINLRTEFLSQDWQEGKTPMMLLGWLAEQYIEEMEHQDD